MENFQHRIDTLTSEFENEFGGLSEEKLNETPENMQWSIAQNIDHLMKVTQSYFPIIEKIRTNKYKQHFLSRFGFAVKFFGNFILKSVDSKSAKKIKTFPVWEPAKGDISGDIVKKFSEQQEELKRLISECDDLIKKGTVISSPASDAVVYKLETAFDIIISHQQRHFEQAKRIKEKLNLNN